MKAARLAVLVVVLAVGACGVRAQRGPDRLGDSVSIVLPDAGEAEAVGSEVRVFLVRDERLVGVVRRVLSPDTEAVVRLMLKGPTEAETAAGLRTAVPVGTELERVTVDAGTARVDLSEPFADVSGGNQVPAVAQLVFTVTEVPGVERVTIAVEGEVIDVPRSDGTLTPGPLTRDDFAAMAPV